MAQAEFISAWTGLVPAMAAPAEGGGGNPLIQLVPIALVFMIFYLLILKPQRKRQQEHKDMLGQLQKGDRILTTGGIYATVLHVKDTMLVATIADGVKVEVAKNAVAARVQDSPKGKKAKGAMAVEG